MENSKEEIIKELGFGATGKFFLIKRAESLFVRKIYRKNQEERLKKEIEICKKVNDIKGVPKILDFSEKHVDFEYKSGYQELFDLVQILSFKEKILVCKQVSEILIACHDICITHRDIKLENILYNKDIQKTLLIDWDCSLELSNIEERSQYLYGTLAMNPPEFSRAKVNDFKKVDVWQLCVTFVELICDTTAFVSEHNIKNMELSDDIFLVLGFVRFIKFENDLFSKVFVEEDERITMTELSQIFSQIYENYIDYL